MKTLARVLVLIAVAALGGAFLVGSLPIRVRPAVLTPPAGQERVNCGTVFSSTEWGSDDACEGPRLGRSGLMVLAFLVALAAFVATVGVLVVSVRRGSSSLF